MNNFKNLEIYQMSFRDASCDETIVHLEMIGQTHTVGDVSVLLSEYNRLGGKINNYIRYVNKNWNQLATS